MKRVLVGAALATASFAASAGERTITLVIDNMTCSLCTITVSKAIKRVAGVTQVTVDYGSKRAVVRFDDAKATWQAIAEASANAGYPARKAE